ncbi:PHA/PHB synthase family protein [Undibacterium pigrum]|uniref:Polyhydroxyalkanoate synthase n=1 Tax=Undibacterium pigrum TaxID=401470 RepID=A0A318IXK2_9BURK|nr:alpha/beta fold hydrolase [Undibacterium pigrum]PXX39924.1 polyhydroxyalkanoate synthase [Undibacterium pigrum]
MKTDYSPTPPYQQTEEKREQLCYLSDGKTEVHPLDMLLQNNIAKLTGGLSPASMALAWMDWGMHIAMSPGKQMELANLLQKQISSWPQLLTPVFIGSAVDKKSASSMSADHRFSYPGWANWPFNAMSQSFLQGQELLQAATTGVRGVSAHHENVVNFMSRQLLDVISPTNIPMLNPEVIATTQATGGRNLMTGAAHWLQDHGLEFTIPGVDTGEHKSEQLSYQPGRDVAVTEGKIVFRNHLIELIQYEPQTTKVYAEPVLIVPSWIMKYYILDLSPHNSLVRFLVSQGHTVFMISWKNPGKEDRNLGMQDYLDSGLFAALEETGKSSQHKAVHAVGYCLGGTLLAIAAAALASEHAKEYTRHLPAVKSLTLLASQTDFTEPGELGLFIDDSQIALLDAQMYEQGYLTGEQMTGSFQLLNSRDLIWSKIMREYQMGTRNSPNDLMSWNADTTRMPYRMHSEYLKHLFLHNDLAEGRYEVHGHAIALNDIQAPMYVLGTVRDHVSPWRSVYKIHVLTDAVIDFVLASSGHNAGIVSEPGHAHRSFQHLPADQRCQSFQQADDWFKAATNETGSWWTHWQAWLSNHSSTTQIKAKAVVDKGLGVAPGSYVFEK